MKKVYFSIFCILGSVFSWGQLLSMNSQRATLAEHQQLEVACLHAMIVNVRAQNTMYDSRCYLHRYRIGLQNDFVASGMQYIQYMNSGDVKKAQRLLPAVLGKGEEIRKYCIEEMKSGACDKPEIILSQISKVRQGFSQLFKMRSKTV